MASEARKMMIVYTIIEKQGLEKSIWVRIGACFFNRDGSMNVFLDALPVNGRLHIRERPDNQERDEEHTTEKGEEA